MIIGLNLVGTLVRLVSVYVVDAGSADFVERWVRMVLGYLIGRSAEWTLVQGIVVETYITGVTAGLEYFEYGDTIGQSAVTA